MRNNENPDQDRYSDDESDRRITARVAATLYLKDGKGVPVFIGNFSRYGVKVQSGLKVEIGEAIMLSIEGLGDFDGVVRWSRQHQFGVHTVDTINVDLLSDQD
jgi:hypothetical protein